MIIERGDYKMRLKDLNNNLYLGQGNNKLIGAENIQFLTWSISAKWTCPFKTNACSTICYAYNDEMRRPNVKRSRMRNWEESQKITFVPDMIEKLNYELERPKNKGKILIVRIHQSGDFYNMPYLKKWVDIADHFKKNKRIIFQAYTKSLPFIKFVDFKKVNIKFIYSIMKDTPIENIEEARRLGLTTFEAKHKSKINKNDILCGGSCGPCLKCYKGKKQINITIEQHGTFKNKVI